MYEVKGVKKLLETWNSGFQASYSVCTCIKRCPRHSDLYTFELNQILRIIPNLQRKIKCIFLFILAAIFQRLFSQHVIYGASYM